MAALSVEPFVAERALNHKVREVEGVYNLYNYFSERKAALNCWGGFKSEVQHLQPCKVRRCKAPQDTTSNFSLKSA